MQPGNAWRFHVELAKAEKAEDLAEVERLRADLHAAIAGRIADKHAEASGGTYA